MMFSTPVTAEDKRWRAESDANTLAEAQVIANDPERMTAAKMAAKRIADEQAERTQGLRKVAGKKPGVKPYTEKEPTGTGGGPTSGLGVDGAVSGLANIPINFLKK